MDNLGWARELVAAPDLETVGGVIHARLQGYTRVGLPQNERYLAERLAFEHQTRHYMTRANERGYAFARAFEGFATNWVDFVDQNKAAEAELARLCRQQSYEHGRADASAAMPAPQPAPPAPPLPAAGAPDAAPARIVLSDAVAQTIDAYVKAEVGKQAAGLAATPRAGTRVERAAAPWCRPRSRRACAFQTRSRSISRRPARNAA